MKRSRIESPGASFFLSGYFSYQMSLMGLFPASHCTIEETSAMKCEDLLYPTNGTMFFWGAVAVAGVWMFVKCAKRSSLISKHVFFFSWLKKKKNKWDRISTCAHLFLWIFALLLLLSHGF